MNMLFVNLFLSFVCSLQLYINIKQYKKITELKQTEVKENKRLASYSYRQSPLNQEMIEEYKNSAQYERDVEKDCPHCNGSRARAALQKDFSKYSQSELQEIFNPDPPELPDTPEPDNVYE